MEAGEAVKWLRSVPVRGILYEFAYVRSTVAKALSKLRGAQVAQELLAALTNEDIRGLTTTATRGLYRIDSYFTRSIAHRPLLRVAMPMFMLWCIGSTGQ